MADEADKQKETEMDDMEVAELANKELRKRDSEIASLKKELAKMKLLSDGDANNETVIRTIEECWKVALDPNSSNYDIAQSLVDIANSEVAAGKPNPFGRDGDRVTEFLTDVLEQCGDDKSVFPQVYQSMIGDDSNEVKMAYRRSN